MDVPQASLTLSGLFTKHGSDKTTTHSYGPIYDELFPESTRGEVLDVIEIGVDHGYSLQALREFFLNAYVRGVDICNVDDVPGVYTVDQSDPFAMSRFARHQSDVDLIIDDGSHRYQDQWTTFLALWPRMKRGGIYIVEDISAVSRWKMLEGVPGFTLHDLRHVKGREDDVIAVFRKFN